jgi:hypothetical protein
MTTTSDLVLPNIAEFNLRHPRIDADPATVDGFVNVGRYLADQSVFWSLDPRVLVLPQGVDRQWYADVHASIGQPAPPLVCPAPRSGMLVADLLHDPVAMTELRSLLRPYDRVRFVTWGAAESLYGLQAALRDTVPHIELDVPAEDDYWSSLYLDSKLSCVDLATQIPGFRVAPGITVDSQQELRGALDTLLSDGSSAIVRGMYGVSGEGSAVVHPDPDSIRRFWVSLRNDPLLRLFPLSPCSGSCRSCRSWAARRSTCASPTTPRTASRSSCSA